MWTGAFPAGILAAQGRDFMTEFLTKTSALPPYLVFPRFLLDSSLNETEKLLYMVLLDRARISRQNTGWTDDQGRVFVCFPIRDLAQALHKGRTAIQDALGALEKAGLILREHQGVMKTNRIFIKCPVTGIPATGGPENRAYDHRKTGLMATGKPVTNKNDRVKTKEQEWKRYDCGEDESL
jgi:hypothetical protein